MCVAFEFKNHREFSKKIEISIFLKTFPNQLKTKNYPYVVARDVLNNLIAANVQDVDNFNWMSQLRYYWKYDDIGMCTHYTHNNLSRDFHKMKMYLIVGR